MTLRPTSLYVLLLALNSACTRSGNETVVPGVRAAPDASALAPHDTVQWSVYRPDAGCVLNLFDAPRVIADASTLQGVLVAFTQDCAPEASAANFDFVDKRLVIERVDEAGFNPNTRETIVPVAVRQAEAELIIEIELAPNCGGAERGPGFIAIVVPAREQAIRVENRSAAPCDYGDGAPPP